MAKRCSSILGALDAVDKAISRPIFHLELGKLEWVIAFLGVWHGVPILALGFPIPQIVTLIVTGSAAWGALAVGLPFLALAFKYVGHIRQGNIMPIYGVKYLFPAIACAIPVSKYFGGDEGYVINSIKF